jgi:hypothetical protein
MNRVYRGVKKPQSFILEIGENPEVINGKTIRQMAQGLRR